MLGKIESRRKRGWQRRWVDGIINSVNMSLVKVWEFVMDRETWFDWVRKIHWRREQLPTPVF